MKKSFTPCILSLPLIILFVILGPLHSYSQKFDFEDPRAAGGFNLVSSGMDGIEITYSVEGFSFSDLELRGEAMKMIQMKGNFLPNQEGAPNLPGNGRFIALPNGAEAEVEIIDQRIERYNDINIAPAPRIPRDTDNEPLHYEKDTDIYSRDAFYPSVPVSLSEKTNVRGVEMVMLGISPFQYNPVSKELIVYRDLKIRVSFPGGKGKTGDDRLRSRWFDPILTDMVINPDALYNVDYPEYDPRSGTPDYEYVIITPEDDDFISWAEELALFRNQQGIRTGIFTTADIGGNSAPAIETFVDDAYANWSIPPVAVLLLGDFGSSGNTIISPLFNNYCASDNIYADVSGNDMPDVVFARMTARDTNELRTMITKVIDYETDPPVSADFYEHPITALGWQTERWFQICSETIGGYFKHVQGKDPVRINEIYQGTPGNLWSTATNTEMVVDYFGPDGLGYIPQTPSELGGWDGGNTSDIINALNAGAFILQHRDHGNVSGWGEPEFTSSDINSLTNTELSYIFSINCATGKFNFPGECFTEKFHRHTYNGENAGALGVLAASEVSFSFVNDTYVWGVIDNMWTDFMPDYQTDPLPRGLLPAFGNAAGKYFLEQSNWPWNTVNKQVTYHLFHHHGCAFSSLYSEVPMNLSVNHENIILSGETGFKITVDDGAFVALSVDGEIIGTGTSDGSEIEIPILPQLPTTVVDLVVTKTNYYRYHVQLDVISPEGPYLIYSDVDVNDEQGNNNGQVDYGESILLGLEIKNVGTSNGENIVVSLESEDPYISITDGQADYGLVTAGTTLQVPDGFAFEVDDSIPDLHQILFTVTATDGVDTWESDFSLQGHTAKLELLEVVVNDAAGNNNGKLDPGETADLDIRVANTGSAPAYSVTGILDSDDPFLDINSNTAGFGEIPAASSGMRSFSITTSVTTPPKYLMGFNFNVTADNGFEIAASFDLTVGQMPILIINLDKNNNSAPALYSRIEELGIGIDSASVWPDNVLSYSNIFLCLGIFPYNTILDSVSGALLADFLEAGGNLYIEGGDTWAFDAQTEVHPMFSISGIDDGEGDLQTLMGQQGRFTEGMSYYYAGDNEWIDRIEAMGSAYNIFENNVPDYYAGVAYDEGDYRTIGTSFEFGGLVDGAGNTTKLKLMEKYLDFFGIKKLENAPPVPDGDTTACPGGNSTVHTNAVEGADFYYWSVEPENAGTVNGNDTTAIVTWSEEYTGMAYLSVQGINITGAGPVSGQMGIHILELPEKPGSALGPVAVDVDETPVSTYTANEAGLSENFLWVITPEEAYSDLSVSADQCVVTWSGSFNGVAGVKYAGMNKCGIGEFSDMTDVQVESSFGLDELAETLGVSIYPNPNKGSFTLELHTGAIKEIGLRLMDARGRLLLENSGISVHENFKTRFDIPGEADEGIYLLLIDSELGTYSRKILVIE